MTNVSEHNTKKSITLDQVKDGAFIVIKAIVLMAIAYGYWFGMLMMMSLFLLNVWHVRIESIFKYTLVLTILSALIYIVSKFLKKRKKHPLQ